MTQPTPPHIATTDGKDLEPEKLSHTERTYAGKFFPTEQIDTLRNFDRLFPSRLIAKGDKIRPLARHDNQVFDFDILSNGQTYDLFDYVARNRVTGLLMLKNGKIAFEHYEHGNTQKTRWISMSMAKSVSTTLVGVAIKDGYIHSVGDLLTAYLPELIGSSYDSVSIKQLMQMTSGVKWDETHTNPNSERRRVLELQIAQKPGEIVKYMASLPRVAEPGELFNYNTGETHMLGALVKAATGQSLAGYLSKRIWAPLGMESDAYWCLEAPDGLELAGSGIIATLHDYARFGQFIMDGGKVGKKQILPEGWVEEACSSRLVGGKRLDYGYMWWIVPTPAGYDHADGFSARGIFGQYIYINPTEKTVLVVWSAREKPRLSEVIIDNDFFHAATKELARLYGR